MHSHRLHPSRAVVGLALLLVFGLGACSGLSNTERGAVGGATTGAVLGGIIADATDNNTAVGAILGAAIGGAAGAAIGSRMDNQADELEEELAGAEVERVGEGIRVTFDSGILFDFDSDGLRAEARANLADLAASLAEYDGTSVLVVGHTDSTGAAAYNQGLSERRAAAARAYLLQQGLQADRVEAMGRGLNEPVADNVTDILRGVLVSGTASGRGINRPAAGKTGTTQENKDAWFVGFTPTLSTAVWIGYENKTAETARTLGDITGGSFPARIWQGFMRQALAGVPVTEFSEPAPIEAIPDAAKLAQRRGFAPGARRSPAGPPPADWVEDVEPPEVDAPTTTTRPERTPSSTTSTTTGEGSIGGLIN